MIVTLAVGALLLGGCSSANSEAPEATAERGPAGAPAFDSDAGKTGDLNNGAAPQAPQKGNSGGLVDSRALIYRGSIVVRVDDVEAASERVAAVASSLGGHVSSEKRSTGARDAAAGITIRVPSNNFKAALDQIADLGKEQHRSSNTEDVTEAVVDLDTRIAAQKASVESVRKMFEQATALSDVVLLERELSQRQADLAALEAKKRRLDDLVALSTIDVSLAGPNTEIVPEKEKSPGFLGGLKNGWNAFVTSIDALLVALGFLLPFLIALAIPIVLLIWWVRHKRRPKAPTAAASSTDSH